MAIYNGNTLPLGTKIKTGDIINFDYIGMGVEILLQPGIYDFETWGALGGGSTSYSGSPAGRGGYAKGRLTLPFYQSFYIFVGQTMNSANYPSFNGAISSSGGGHPGGGASDIRLVKSLNWYDSLSLRSRILIAGGGGSAGPFNFSSYNRYGGGLFGGDASQYNKGGTQISGGISTVGEGGTFGYGSNSGATGGGGYYGGAGGSHVYGAGAGGSGFISGHEGCIAIISATNQNPKTLIYSNIEDSYHYSNFIFTNTILYNGNTEMPNPRGVTNIIGNSGQGYVKITVISTGVKFLILTNNNINTVVEEEKKYFKQV